MKVEVAVCGGGGRVAAGGGGGWGGVGPQLAEFLESCGVISYGSGRREGVVNQCWDFSKDTCFVCNQLSKYKNMVLSVHRNREAYWGWGEGGEGDMEVGGEGDYISILHFHLQNDSCVKMGSDESHFNVSLIVRDKVTRQCPQTTIFEEKGELKQIRTEVPLLTSLPPYR